MRATLVLIMAATVLKRLSAGLELPLLPSWHNELFGNGDFYDVPEGSRVFHMHLSSSTEDLMRLFRAEQRLLTHAMQCGPDCPELTSRLSSYLPHIDYNLTMQDAEEYVEHPVNAFHLMKRTSTWLSGILQNTDLSGLDVSLQLPDKGDFALGSALGLINIVHYHDLDVTELAQGLIVDPQSGRRFVARSALSVDELIMVANAAKSVQKLNQYATWLEVTLHKALQEQPHGPLIPQLRRIVKKAKRSHDNFILDHGFFQSSNPMQFSSDTMIITNLRLFDKKLENQPAYQSARNSFQRNLQALSSFDDLLRSPALRLLGSERGRGDHINSSSRMSLAIEYYLHGRTVQLCRGQTQVRPPEPGLNCLHLHHQDPYLRLGPFKFELLHRAPEIGVLRDFGDARMMEALKSRSRGSMKSTPYALTNDKENAYSRLRTSKIKYVSHDHDEEAMRLTHRIHLATRLKLSGEPFASENFQIMNYGIGGAISGHVDSVNATQHGFSSETVGGARTMTFMLYMSTVKLGGLTVFPQAGVAIRPVYGEAVFWFNHDAAGQYDSRTFHLGCPVVVGNKWIANKWIKWQAQLHSLPCATHRRHYSINNQS